MATALTATPVRVVGGNARYTGLPKIPIDTAVATTDDKYPSSRIVRRASVVTSNATHPTWIAQAHSSGVKVCLVSGAATTMSGYTVDPTLVDYASVTRTYQRPRNQNGGKALYTVNLGTATLKYGATTLATQAITEDNQSLLSGLNTWTVARKLPPLTPLNLTTPSAINIYQSGVLGSIFDVPVSVGKAFRWLGGNVSVTATVPTTPLTISVYAVPITAGHVDDLSATGVVVGTIATTPGVPTTRIFTAAEITTATVVRWDQFWLVAARTGGAPPTSTANYALYSPTDVPPPYDCPGVDSFISGGFLT